MKQNDIGQPVFKPITLMTYLSTAPSTQDKTQSKLHDYHKLLKMKKILNQTQQKMLNRINLFKKSSDKILKKRQSEFKVSLKQQCSISNPSNQWVRSRQQIKTAEGKRKRQERSLKFQTQQIRAAQKILQERVNNVRTLKEQKQRFKVLMEQRKKIEMQRKLQTASAIRKNRINAKLIKQKLQSARRQNFARQIAQKYDRQRDEFVELEHHLNELQLQEERALLDWKKTVPIIPH